MPEAPTKTEAVVETPVESSTPDPKLDSREAILESLQKIDADAEADRETELAILEGRDKLDAPEQPEGETDVAETTDSKQPETPKNPTTDDIATERKKLDQERLEFEQQKRQFDERAASAKKEIETAEQQANQLEKFAKEWDESGDTALADSARKRAQKIRSDVESAKTESNRAEFRRSQETVLRQIVTEFPELSKPDSQMTKDMDALLKFRPQFLTYPEGIRDAAIFLASKNAASRSQALEKENSELRAQLDKVQKRLQPARGTTSAPKGEPSFATLTPDQQRARLLSTMRREEAFT